MTTPRVLTMTSGAVALLVGGWVVAVASGRPETLRSRHSDPAATAPASTVAVTPNGKLYHRPACTFIHGPALLESGPQAVADGYTPCTRCMKP